MMEYLGSFVWTGNPNLMGSPCPASGHFCRIHGHREGNHKWMGFPRPEWPQWSNAVGEPKVIVFDFNLTTFEISVENTTAMDNYSADIQTAGNRFPTAGAVFDYFNLKP
jgi:hypothetical protein